MADNLCLENCLHGRKDSKDMLRCCLCAQWFHLDCVNLPPPEATGVWPCLDCHQMPANVKTVTTNVQLLTNLLTKTISKLERTEEERKKERDTLMKDNATLRETLTTINSKMTQASWSNFRANDTNTTPTPAPSSDRALLGSSIIRSIDVNKLTIKPK